jgi:hypothetical protein
MLHLAASHQVRGLGAAPVSPGSSLTNTPVDERRTPKQQVLDSVGKFGVFKKLVVKEFIEPAGIRVSPSDCIRPVLEYDKTCTDTNIERYTYREDVFRFCQIELAKLVVLMPDFGSDTAGTPEEAMLWYEWIQQVYSWISIAFFAADVQPWMLFPEAESVTQTIGEKGQYRPVRNGFGENVQQAMAGIKLRLDEAGAKGFGGTDARGLGGYWYGPTWYGFHDTGFFHTKGSIDKDPRSAPYLSGTFGMDVRQMTDGRLPKVQSKPVYFGTMKQAAAFKATSADKMVADPEKALRVFFVQNAPYKTLTVQGVKFTAPHKKEPIKRVENTAVVSPRAMMRLARAWAIDVVSAPMLYWVTQSFGWYSMNHLVYFQDMLGLSSEEIVAVQKGTAQAATAAKNAKTDMILGAVVAVATMVATLIPGWGTLIGAIIIALAIAAKFIAAAVFKKREKPPKCPQPAGLRTLAYAGCDVGSTTSALGDVANMQAVLLQSELTESAMGGHQTFPWGGGAAQQSGISTQQLLVGGGLLLGLAVIMGRK